MVRDHQKSRVQDPRTINMHLSELIRAVVLVLLLSQGCLLLSQGYGCQTELQDDGSKRCADTPPKALVNMSRYGPCSLESCGGRRDPELYKVISTYFKDSFYSRCDIYQANWCLNQPDKCDTQVKKKAAYARLRPLCLFTSTFRGEPTSGALAVGAGDNDRCCITRRQFQAVDGWRRDKDSHWCYVFGLDTNNDNAADFFQTAQVGNCDANSANGCSGTCRQFASYVSLACFCAAESRFTFRLFQINSYCSCQS